MGIVHCKHVCICVKVYKKARQRICQVPSSAPINVPTGVIGALDDCIACGKLYLGSGTLYVLCILFAATLPGTGLLLRFLLVGTLLPARLQTKHYL